MVLTNTPANPYARSDWLKKPKNAKVDQGFDKYMYKNGESLASIAAAVSKPWNKLTGNDLTQFNWSTATAAEVNYYLKEHNGCTRETTDGNNYRLSESDTNPFIWVPKMEKLPSGKHRSPGKKDVGHVALDDDKKRHFNTLVIRPVYTITLELGDVDALFDPVGSGDPEKSKGVQQRLAVLGYLYTPLGHSKIEANTKKCWDYYRIVNDSDYGALIIYNQPVASQTRATVEVKDTKIVLKITGGANAGTQEVAYTGNKATLGGLATAIKALNKGWVVSVSRKETAQSAKLARLPATDAQGATNYQVCHSYGLSKAEALARLQKEVQNNLLAVVKGQLPDSGVILDGRLPQPGKPQRPGEGSAPPIPAKPGEFAMIRFPGGYCFTYPQHTDRRTNATRWEQKPSGDWVPKQTGADAKYNFTLESPRFMVEDALWKDCELLGKIPLVATVQQILPNGKRKPAEGVSVYFQLVKPDELKKGNVLRAPDLRDTVMDYDKDWARAELHNRPMTVPLSAWPDVQRIGRGALAIDDATQRNNYITAQVNSTTANNTERTTLRNRVNAAIAWAEGARPLIKSNLGPKKFLKDAMDGQDATDTDDPQKDNVDKKYGGKRRIPVEGEGTGTNFKPGVFEVDKTRKGLHERRSDKHADYGTMTPAKKVQPTEEDAPDGTKVKRHTHAVCAKTNDKGYAGVIFTPSRIGGDTYRLRAYVGPETLAFDGTDHDGPMAETGTMVVWRNIRLNRYLQSRVPAKADVAQNIKDAWNDAFPGLVPSAFDQGWTMCTLTSQVGNVDISYAGTAEGEYDHTTRQLNASFNHCYRPVKHRFIGLAEQYRRCYCELIVDCGRVPEAMKRSEFVAAMAAARKAAKDSNEVSVRVDWENLLLDPDADNADPEKMLTPWTFNLRERSDYNANRSGGFPHVAAGKIAEIRSALYNHALHAYMAHFAGGGVLPGLTVIQMPYGDTWEGMGHSNIVTSGDAGPGGRAATLWYTDGTYRGNGFCYSTTANTAHELGHTLVRPHALGAPGTGGARADSHQAVADSVCIMSYKGCYGEYCGRCVLALRGWMTSGGAKNDGTANTDGI